MADNKEIDYDSLSDEDFLEALEIAGSEESETENEEETDIEDTNQEEESEEEDFEETETEDQDDEIDSDTGSEEETETEDELEGNTQIETNSEESEETEPEGDEETESDESETNENPAEDGKETEEINYEEQYKALLGDNEKLKGFENFYNEVTSEFMANGKKIKGFTDPKKIIESQQMAAGFSDKMAGFSKYKPFMNTLKDKGMLDSPEKFNLAMNLLDGDQEAIKQHIKNLEIDPFEMDMENINYEGKNQVSSNLEIAYDDILESAKAQHVDQQVQQVISKDWDNNSVIELLEDPQSSADLVNHISTGAYDVVQERIAEKKRTDVNQVYTSKPMIEQYREAAREIETEYINHVQGQQQQQMQNQQYNQQVDEQAVQTEIARIEQERSDEEYRSKVEKQNAKSNAARKKATSVSKKKPRTKTTKKVFDPGLADDEEFSKYLDSIIYS